VSETHVSYKARPDATPEREREMLASVYAFVLRTHRERREASFPRPPENAEGNPDEPGAAPITRDR
jgi:hypothetical protein